MRARMADEHRTQSIWEVKHHRGGLVDIEFIAQYLQLLHANRFPAVLSPNTREALSGLRAAGVLAADIADDLIDALELWQAVQHRVRLNIGEAIRTLDGDGEPKPLRLTVDGIAGLDFDRLVNKMHSTARRVHAHFRRIVEEPAEAARARLAQE
jgi:glutamate-ammonia-ligase adenylyltransferase